VPKGSTTVTCVLMLALASATSACIQDLFQDCDGIQKEARELVEHHQGCSSGDSCIRIEMGAMAGGSCLGAFQCSQAIHADTDLDAFSAQVTALNHDYGGCSMCVMAGCINPQEVTACCDPETGTCVLDTGSVCPAPQRSP